MSLHNSTPILFLRFFALLIVYRIAPEKSSEKARRDCIFSADGMSVACCHLFGEKNIFIAEIYIVLWALI
jgi:hypothetical protein